jgi:hypothetical protein
MAFGFPFWLSNSSRFKSEQYLAVGSDALLVVGEELHRGGGPMRGMTVDEQIEFSRNGLVVFFIGAAYCTGVWALMLPALG